MKKYVFSEYDEAGGIGSEKIFKTEAEAVKVAEEEWYRMCHADKKRYLSNPISEFRVFEIEIENEEELENVQECFTLEDIETDNIWNAKQEIEISFRSNPCAVEWQTLERLKGIDEVEKFDFLDCIRNEIDFISYYENLEISEEYTMQTWHDVYICRDVTFIDEKNEKQMYTYRYCINEMY